MFKFFQDFYNRGISLCRPITDYRKVQLLWSYIIRNGKWQLGNLDLQKKRYCNVGCGKYTKPNFINIDCIWSPGLDLCWDIRKGLPLPDKSVEGIFIEHCLEHFSLNECKKLLREFQRILKKGGTLRAAVPDGEIYVNLYIRSRSEGNAVFAPLKEEYSKTPMTGLNYIFRHPDHSYVYDAETLSMHLAEAGFIDIRKESFLHGRDQELLIDREARKGYSLYMEASA